MRDYLRQLLGDWELSTAVDGDSALAAARAQPHDLVITDIMMPGTDGFALLEALRADPRTQMVPVLMLSARAGEESRVSGLAAGADDYVTKPFNARELTRACDRCSSSGAPGGRRSCRNSTSFAVHAGAHADRDSARPRSVIELATR